MYVQNDSRNQLFIIFGFFQDPNVIKL